MQTSQITLNYTCDSAEHADTITAEQPLTEVVIAGGLVCPECDEDMYLSGEVTVSGTHIPVHLIDGIQTSVRQVQNQTGDYLGALDNADSLLDTLRLYFSPPAPTAVEAWLDVTRDPQLSAYWARRGGRTAFIADYNAAEH